MRKELSFEDLEIREENKLGFGFMAEVFLGIDKMTKEKYAIKVVNLNRKSPREIAFI